MTSSRFLAIGKNRIIGHYEIEKEDIGGNKIASYFKIEPEMKDANGDLSDVKFFIKK